MSDKEKKKTTEQKPEKPIKLNMDFNEAIKRLVRVKPQGIKSAKK